MSRNARLLPGVALGLAAAFAWAVYNVGIDIGRDQGFSSADLTLLRYVGGAATLLPLMLLMPRHGAALSRPRLALLILLAGPGFAWLINTGYGLAPLSHAVVIAPGMTMIVATALARLVDGVPLSAVRLAGMVLLLAGLAVIGADRAAPGGAEGLVWLGDLCFLATGTLWGIFTWLLGRWRLDAVQVTGQIALASSLVFLPFYCVVLTPSVMPAAAWAAQAVYQGLLGGALAIVFYAAAVARLGPQGGGLFPALVPPLAVLLALPMTGIAPNHLQLAGIALATLGLVVSLDLASAFRRRSCNPDRSTASR